LVGGGAATGKLPLHYWQSMKLNWKLMQKL
jgi:hypothetical protein